MKKAMSSFDLKAVIQELQSFIGSRVEKAYQKKDDISIRVRSREHGKKDLVLVEGNWFFLRECRKQEGHPGTFAMVLRKHLSNAILTGVHQHDFDRIAVFDFQKRDEFQLIFELFGRGNVVLTSGGRIVGHLRRESWSSREIKVGEEYKFPPGHQSPLDISREEFVSLMKKSQKDLVRTLAVDLNLGGIYSEELCMRAEVDKNSPASQLSDEQIDRVYEELGGLFLAIRSKKLPSLILKKGKVVDVTPIPLRQYDGFETKPFDTMSEALEHFVMSRESQEEVEENEVAQFERRIQQQEDALKKSIEREKSYRKIAECIQTNAEFLESILESVREGESDVPNVEFVNYEEHTATLALPNGMRFQMDYSISPYDNANIYFEKAKKEKAKRGRLQEAIQDTKKELVKAAKHESAVSDIPRAEPTKQFWFDAYRWFISSEGFLVIGGRDAKSNDRLVKKHLKEGDRYAHAEARGAPGVVVKEGSKASEITMREACQFAVAFSKAWRAGIGAGSAYWVKPEQVSKTPESGEFLPKGAFVIRGKRNHFHDLKLEVAVGEIVYNGSRKIMCGPRSAVEAQVRKPIVIRPGDVRKELIAKKLSMIFRVPVDEILRILPPGGCEIAEPRTILRE